MRRLWLLFAQTITIALALWFIVLALKPDWLRLASPLTSETVTISTVQVREASPLSDTSARSYREASAQAMPAVVNIYTTTVSRQPPHPFMNDPFFRRFFGDRQGMLENRQSSLGSGVVVSPQGYILTNNHVIEAADEIEIALADGRKMAAKLVGTDPETDLAVIKVSDSTDLPAITLARAEDIQVGDVVLAIGNPFGVGQTVTMGIVSALGRSQLGINTFENFIQTDAAINPGNSGGALVDTRGNLIGINTAIYSRTGGSLGIGFAIPVTTVKTVMEEIIRHGRVVRGWIGVEPQDITPDLVESFNLKQRSGAIIAGVLKGGPADRAGMLPGDILIAVEDKPLNDTTEMLNHIASLKPGYKARMTILRRGQENTLEVTVGTRPVTRRTE